MKGLNLGFQKGFPVAIDELSQLQGRDQEIVDAIASSIKAKYGGNFQVLSGLDFQTWNGGTESGIAAGWAIWNGELLELRADAVYQNIVNYNDLVFTIEKIDTQDVIWGDGIVRETHYRNVLKVESNSGSLNVGEIRCADVVFMHLEVDISDLLGVNMSSPTSGNEPLLVVEGQKRSLNGSLSFAGAQSFAGSVTVAQLSSGDSPSVKKFYSLTYYRPGLSEAWQGMLTVETNGDVIVHPERGGNLAGADEFSVDHVSWTI